MWRALIFVGLLCLAAYGAVWLANHPETVAVTWAGREYTTSLAIGVVGLVMLALLISATFGALRFVVALPSAVGRGSRKRRQARGQLAITRGIVAVGSGDVAAARRHAAEAERLIGHEPLALLLKAQAAQASGDRAAAEAAFRQMSQRQETRVLGLRGLYLEARRRDDLAAAREFAEEAARAAPAIAWASDAVIEARSADGDWRSAVQTIERRTSLGLVDRTTSRRQRAVLLTADAMAREGSDPEGALATAQEAARLAPDLVPAASLAGRLLSRRGDLKKAARVLEGAWRAEPHPEIASAYLNLRPGDSAIDRLRRAETLARLSSWSDEARLAIARSAIEARELGRARDVLRPLLDEGRPTVRVCSAMAEIEGRSGNAGGSREWLARAARAPRDKAWIADGFVAEAWAPVSPVTGRLDAFRWDTPPDLLGGPDARQDAGYDPAIYEPAPQPDEEPLAGLLGSSRPRPEPEPIATQDDVEAAESLPADPAPPRPPEPPRGEPEGGERRRPETASAPMPEAPSRPGSAQARPGSAQARPGATPAPPGAAPAPPGAAPARPDPAAARQPAAAARTTGPSPRADPVIFPVPRAPDDPGPDGGDGDRRQRFRLRV